MGFWEGEKKQGRQGELFSVSTACHLYLGIDFGTSGARSAVVDAQGNIQFEGRFGFTEFAGVNLADSWKTGLFALLAQIPKKLKSRIQAIALNGTSSTVVLCNEFGEPVAPPMLYNDARGAAVIEQLRDLVPPQHTVLNATSSLVKLLWMSQSPSFAKARYFLHQADWLGFLLHGRLGVSDYHNALKLGYDVENLEYPQWLTELNLPISLPHIVAPGSAIAQITPQIVQDFELSPDCLVCAGTTDSIAAFLASGAKYVGEAVTSLGSTLAVKLLSHTRIEDARYGIYSHRFPSFNSEKVETPFWLVGGASNTGGAVLKHFFSNTELNHLSQEINLKQPSKLDYYPLLKPGERFPINDPQLSPRLEPRPQSHVEFLHGLLTGIAKIEAQGYELLQKLGADKLNHVYTAGGGANNLTWLAIRQQYLQVPVETSRNTEAAYGSALLAMKSQI
ncbi:FGGY-family carbohydrate kinase [Calothrix sp. PCC 6303]|uniref:FGGY-family carbohydrate kinase n=1 Tax=Calothrix sp. PCC 6303 TaxID=1170562 RepID=UPI0002A0136D|nr:FGGY-family carbohydrate kinase [Calothrix sp. PCC 6303]AFZ00362.1 Carbohydrate kinase, FGGY [Calothrix sp. PCC 6303]